MDALQLVEHVAIHLECVALSQDRAATLVRLESKPVEIPEDGSLVFRAASNAIMILEPQEHAAAERAGNTPRVDGVDEVPEVKIARG
jgi:hypothetical protein